MPRHSSGYIFLITTVLTAGQVKLPVEVTGAPGTESAVTLDISPALASQISSLRLRIHGLEFDGMVSVRINQGEWQPLTNKTVTIAEPGRGYGGIGGGFATLKLTLAVPPGAVTPRSNTVRFRLNRTDGVVSGFRVLSLNFLTADGREVLPASAFHQDDPNAWTPPLSDAASIATGKELWDRAKLTANGLPGAPGIRANCSDCHAQDGRDLKYFNFSNGSIVARSRFHGLSELEGIEIASYIRSLSVPNPGRPWNPPYQPGPGLDSQPAVQWAAGAGLSRILEDDRDSLPFLFPAAIGPDAFRPDGNLNPREIPVAMQLPDWNHWLPRIHPLDRWGRRFEGSAFRQLYEAETHASARTEEDMRTFFNKWSASRSKFLTPLPPQSKQWSAELSEAYYSAQLWQLVKTWELTQGLAAYAGNTENAGARVWLNTIPALTAPAEAGIPNGPAGMGGSALTNEYFNNAWYELQILANSGSHRHHGRTPVDWPYIAGHFRELDRLSGRHEPARLLIAIAKAMQSTDPRLGPGNYAEGWRPDQNLDPRILVSDDWAPVFAELPETTRRALAESLLTAWLDKTLRYSPASYFVPGMGGTRYSWPDSLRGVTGGKVWEAAEQFQKAGIGDLLIQRIRKWGEVYNSTADLFHY